MVCALCHTEVGQNVSREHVFASWIGKHFPTDEKRVTYRRGFQDRGQDWEPEFWLDTPFNLRVRDLCEPCNTQWCNDIETEAQSILTPMMLGKPVTLDAGAQLSLAIWATKTLLMLQMTGPKDRRSIPPRDFLWFRNHRWPLPYEQIWIAQYDGSGDWPLTSHQYGLGLYNPAAVVEPPDDVNGHAIAFAVGHLVFRAFGHTLKTGPVDAPGEPLQGALQKIWPMTGDSIDYPPATLIEGDAGMRALVDSFGPGGQMDDFP